ncbi:DUF4362 domain-containing protein [Paenibacillus thiaminolyticus]|uniref:DUF4362 domain-containing protein n=1 Tax=Paenibacillus thiaminolyticus TaxID=49283 RepID=UPI003D26B1AA
MYSVEGDAILYDVHTDGETIQYTIDNTRDAFAQDAGIQKTTCKNIIKEEDAKQVTYMIEGGKEWIGGPYDPTKNIGILLLLTKQE